MTRTQYFAAFCQERAEIMEQKGDDTNEIKFFDQKCIEKKNRHLLKHKKNTPFLDDKSYKLSKVFVCNPPNSNNLENKVYTYQTFPKQLLSKNMGKIRTVDTYWDIFEESSNKVFKRPTLKSQKTHTALQKLMAMQYAKKIDKLNNWDNYTTNVIKTQQIVRMYINRMEYIRYKKNTIQPLRDIIITKHSRSEFVKLRKDVLTIQTYFKNYVSKQKSIEKIYHNSVTVLQACFKGYYSQKKMNKYFNDVNVLQSLFKTRYQQIKCDKILQSTSLIQTYIKTRNARTQHTKNLEMIRQCQAILRGTIVRREQNDYLRNKIISIRKKLLQLWDQSYTSFMYRAKFWIVYETPNYLNLAIHNEEIDRLNNILNIFRTNSDMLNEAKIRFNKEKIEIKRLLKDDIDESIKKSLYITNNINIKKVKHKKDKLINTFFNVNQSINESKISATTLLTICTSHGSSVLDVTSQIELRKQNRIRNNLMLIVLNSIRSMQNLNHQLIKQKNINRKQKNVIKNLNDEIIYNNNNNNPFHSINSGPFSTPFKISNRISNTIINRRRHSTMWIDANKTDNNKNNKIIITNNNNNKHASPKNSHGKSHTITITPDVQSLIGQPSSTPSTPSSEIP